jgi:diguanylate cyclase (GGDEF)-like protein
MSADATTLTIWQRLADPYRRLLVAVGAATLALCAYELPVAHLDLGFLLLGIVTVVVSSRVSVPIPRINATVTVSDTFTFLTLLLYGTEAAVMLAALEGICSGARVSKRPLGILCNAGALVCATFIAGTLAAYAFGQVTDFEQHPTSTFVSFICLLALAQYAVHTCLGATYLALKSSQPLFRTWTKHYLWASVTYFVGAPLAGLIAKLAQSISFYSLIFPLPVIAIVYLSYRKYLEDVRSTAAKAEQAERDRAEAERERAEAEHIRAEQAERHVEELSHYIAKLESAQAELSESKEHFRHAAYHDTLTALPNRMLFTDHLRLAIERTRRDETYAFAVLFLDVDRFKNINDSLGHTYGDQLLTEIAGRLLSCTRQLDTVARFGGDEFAILVDGIGVPEDAVRVAQKIQQELLVPFDLNGHEAFTSASIGIALSGTSYIHPEDLLRDADTAMYRAKDSGKARHEVFDRAMHTRAVTMLRLENDLRRALERQEFRVHYQPILTLKTGELAGFEALARWERPDRGLVSPAEFIPVAEETGMIVPLGLWVLEEACNQLREWQQAAPANRALTMSVNLSGKQLSQSDVAEQVQDVLYRTNLDPRHLKLEITESVVMENAEAAAVVLASLRALGVGLSIDDFGTGYSSLSYLHRFPVNTLKVDRSFVSRMTSGDENLEIVRTIVTLARNLGMDVVAEGIETGEQLAQLKALKCEYGQGYLFAKPLDAAAAHDLLLQRDLNAPNRSTSSEQPDSVVTTLRSPLVM